MGVGVQTDLDSEPGGDVGSRRLGVYDQSAEVNNMGRYEYLWAY